MRRGAFVTWPGLNLTECRQCFIKDLVLLSVSSSLCWDGKVKCSRYRPGVTQRLGRGIALLFHDRGTRRGWVVSSMLRPHFASGVQPISIVQEAGWAPGPVWTDGKSRPHRDSIPDRLTRSQSLYRLSYPTHLLRWYLGLYQITCRIWTQKMYLFQINVINL